MSTEIQGVVKDKTIYSRGIKPVIQSDLFCDPAWKHHDQRNTVRCDLSFLAPINILVVTLVTFVHNKVFTSHDFARARFTFARPTVHDCRTFKIKM